MDTTQPSQTKPGLVLLTDAWGPKYGGINSFNMDFAKGLGLLLRETHQVICVVLDATDAEREAARKKHVQLLSVGRSEHHGHFEASRAHDVVASVRREAPGVPILWWIGHDTITGDLALALPNAAGEGQSALINHMSYQDYVSYKHGVGEKAKLKAEKQHRLFSRADKVFAVGPLLRDRLADMLGREVPMLVPGLAEIEPSPLPRQLTGITFGRLDPENDRIKQGELASAAFASAYREARLSPAKTLAYKSPPLLHVIGLATSGGEEEASLHRFVESKAGRVLTLIPVPYDDDRDRVFDQLRRCSLAMMLSWHEGFGLTGWEAIAAAVPLIVSQNSGVYQLVDETLGGSGIGCLHALEVGGRMGDETGQNFRDEDEVAARNAILKIASDPERAKKDAARLHEQLVREDFTWQGTARTFVKALGIVAAEAPLEIHAMPTHSADSGSAGPEPRPVTSPAKTASASPELLELRPPSSSMVESFAISYLLRAEEECVPFHSQRQPLLQELLDWACSPSASPVALQLRIGPGGSGKTRLLRKVCSELAAQGWRAGFLRMDSARDVRRAMEQLVRSEAKSLVVVDYAEGRIGEVLDVVEAALKVPSGHRVCIVLVARDAGDWWQRLPNERKSLEPFLSGLSVYGPYRMPPLQNEGQTREQIFHEAVSAFGSRLGRSTDAIVCPDLSAPHFGDLIYIHLSALSSLTGEQPETASGLLDAVLNHELRYWRQASLPLGIDRGEDRLSQAMLAFTLCNGARTRAEAKSLLKRIPRLRELSGDQRDRIIDVLLGFYPVGSGVDALRPDVLGEKLVARELVRDDEPLDCLLGNDSDDKTREAVLTVLTRLATRQSDQIQWLRTALERHLVDVTRAAVKVSVALGQPLGNLFAEVLASAPKPQQVQVVDRLLPILPDKTEALAEVALLVAELRLERLRAKGPPKNDKQRHEQMMAYRSLAYWLDTLGRWEDALLAAQEDVRLAAMLASARTGESMSEHATALSNQGVNLGKLGHTDLALERSQAALTIRRRLALQRPDAYRANLATSLSNTANHLRDVGQYEEGLKLSREALEIRRELALQRPDAYRADLATSLSNTANHLRDVGQYEEGLKLSREALEIRRELALQRPDAYRADLATSLSNTANRLRDVGQYEEGLKLSREALEIRRELALQRPDAYRADLATSLSITANRLRDVGQYEEGLKLSREALEIWRELAPQRPDAYRANLATSFSNTAEHLRDVGLNEEGVKLSREALEIWRELALQRPDAYRANLATSLSNTANHLRDVGQYEEGLKLSREALEIRRELALQRPDAYRADLATSLSNTANHLRDVGQYEEGLKLSREALEIRRELALQRPDAYRADLATSLSNTANRLRDVGLNEEGVKLSREALEIWRELALQRPDAYRANLATSLSNTANHLRDVGQYEEGLKLSREALEIRRELALQRPDAYRADLATSLSNTANHLRDVGQYEEGLKLSREALEIRRELALQRPDAYRADLATSLSNTANRLRDVGQYEEGLKLSREALEIRRELALQRPDAYRADLATSLSITANRLRDVGQYEEGLKLSREALEIWRELAPQRPDAYRAELAASLGVLGDILCERKEMNDARASIEEAREILRQRMTTHGEPPARDQLAFASGIETKILVMLGEFAGANEVAMEGLGYLEKDLQLRPRKLPPKEAAIVRAMIDVAQRSESLFPHSLESVQPKPTVASASMNS